ncbi:unnamed protein product [Symbiodinium sp. CCMP2592]|nr:unnamed protein product [Symbiodinium sp. CCMP2592]
MTTMLPEHVGCPPVARHAEQPPTETPVRSQAWQSPAKLRSCCEMLRLQGVHVSSGMVAVYSRARSQLGLVGMASRFCLYLQTVLDLLCSTLMAQWLLEIFLDCMPQAVVGRST